MKEHFNSPLGWQGDVQQLQAWVKVAGSYPKCFNYKIMLIYATSKLVDDALVHKPLKLFDYLDV
ncbi:hypothetical protein NIES1031_04400 [Chroogloeocystis siderophila 5.2 s.c.1]|jgi:hypothetical protein|uniref:Uncharacterized protein n=1 Tax=Chroogloeocystis siderophila 5.2 s.c.1 TaxID=247279 RepID=A0A1U7HXY8_9CHRO|nr:hypothetical protein [Chroogloeocystis siderophila]OKH28483.1 hypothetical protein NIES1031_04400 [Chroogloeocystis siderophila 5.2 s.c.1]